MAKYGGLKAQGGKEGMSYDEDKSKGLVVQGFEGEKLALAEGKGKTKKGDLFVQFPSPSLSHFRHFTPVLAAPLSIVLKKANSISEMSKS